MNEYYAYIQDNKIQFVAYVKTYDAIEIFIWDDTDWSRLEVVDNEIFLSDCLFTLDKLKHNQVTWLTEDDVGTVRKFLYEWAKYYNVIKLTPDLPGNSLGFIGGKVYSVFDDRPAEEASLEEIVTFLNDPLYYDISLSCQSGYLLTDSNNDVKFFKSTYHMMQYIYENQLHLQPIEGES